MMLWIDACREAGVDPIYAFSQVMGEVKVNTPSGTVWVSADQIKTSDIQKITFTTDDYPQLIDDLRNC